MNKQVFASKKHENVFKAKLTPAGTAMYLAGKVKLCRANDVAKAANKGKGFVLKTASV